MIRKGFDLARRFHDAYYDRWTSRMTTIVTMHEADGTHNVSHERNERRPQISPPLNDPSEIPGMNLDTRLRHF
jgi:hypothetical protein